MRTRSFLAALATFATALLGLAVPAHAADQAHDPILNCSFWHHANGVIVFAGEAHAPATHQPIVSLTLTCTFRGATETHAATATVLAPVAAVSGTAFMSPGPVVVCERGEARYADGHVATVTETCGQTFPEAGPPPEAEPSMTCTFARQSQSSTWAVVVTGFAGSRDVALSTSVSCTLTDANDAQVVAQATSIGSAVAATGAKALPLAPLVSKCSTLSIQYRVGTASFETCEAFG